MTHGDSHLTRDCLVQLAHRQVPAERLLDRALRHLRELCPDCREEQEHLWASLSTHGAFDALLAGVAGRAQGLAAGLDTVRETARRELAALLELSPVERKLAVCQADGRLRNPFLVTLLLEHARERRPEPREALAAIDLAIDVAARVEHRVYGAAFVLDLVAQALAEKGDLLRELGDLAGAEEALVFALRLFAEDRADDPQTEAEILLHTAALRRDQRRLGEARAALEKADRLFRDIGDRRGAAALQVVAESVEVEERRWRRAVA